MMEIFEGHKDLISRLNYFLPDGYEIKLPSEEEQCHAKLEGRSYKYLNLIDQFESVDHQGLPKGVYVLNSCL